MSEFWQNIFYAFVAEIFVVLTAWLVKEDKRRQVLVLTLGTTIAGTIGFGTLALQNLSTSFSDVLMVNVPTTSSQPTSEVFSDLSMATQEPEPSSVSAAKRIDFMAVSLAPIANHPMDNLTYPLSGEYIFNDIPFTFLSDVKAIFQSQHHLLESYPTRATLETSIPYPESVYFLINGGYVYKSLQGQTVGKIILKFDNSEILITELIVGQNLRENWGYTSGSTSVPREEEVIASITNPVNWQNIHTEPQFRGEEPASGYIDLIIIPITSDLQATTLIQIEIQDESFDPSLVIYGITVAFAQ